MNETNFDEAKRFIAALARASSVTFQTFDDTPAKQSRLAKVLHGSVEQHQIRLQKLNNEGAGIFMMVNQGDGRARRAANVNAVRAVFVDLDGAPLGPVLAGPIPPHIVVESSPQRWHAYWLVEGVALKDFPYLQSQLAIRFNGDPSVKDLPRVMRIPGFHHHKQGKQLTKLITVRDDESVTVSAFMKAFDICPPIHTGERNNAIFRAASGFKRAGVPEKRAFARIVKMNAQVCDVPLEQTELAAAVEHAYGYAAKGFSQIPHAVVDTPEFDQLSGSAVKLFVYAMRRHRPGKSFPLTHGDFKHIRGCANRQGFRAAIEELLQAGFLIMVRNYSAALESDKRLCALYQIAEGVQIVPKAHGI